jgi:RNA polymerase sigma-70 factor (ECF subfamily)
MTGEATIAVARGLASDAAARVGTLFDVYHPRLYRLARRMVRDPDAARDLVQETFLRAARSPQTIPADTTGEEAWLVRVLINLCRDRWRRQTTRERLDDGQQRGDVQSAPSDPEAALIARSVVWHALERLAPRRRAVLILHELEGASVGHIAKLFGISATTVRWHLSRGRRDLVRAISQQGLAE